MFKGKIAAAVWLGCYRAARRARSAGMRATRPCPRRGGNRTLARASGWGPAPYRPRQREEDTRKGSRPTPLDFVRPSRPRGPGALAPSARACAQMGPVVPIVKRAPARRTRSGTGGSSAFLADDGFALDAAAASTHHRASWECALDAGPCARSGSFESWPAESPASWSRARSVSACSQPRRWCRCRRSRRRSRSRGPARQGSGRRRPSPRDRARPLPGPPYLV
jgi:hypothetical protein